MTRAHDRPASERWHPSGLPMFCQSENPATETALGVFLDSVLSTTAFSYGEGVNLQAHVKDTTRRVTKMFCEELLSGYNRDPRSVLGTTFEEPDFDEIILVRDIPFYSLCAHHLLPFHGMAHVAYLPNRRVVGLSKIPRLVECLARRLQIQERLTREIAGVLLSTLECLGVACVTRAEHLCMSARGIRAPGAQTVTSTMLGAFRDNPQTRAEVLALLGTP